jgi:exonuclease SbcD
MGRVIFTADWHFGAGNTWGKIDPETGRNSSLAATITCAEEMLAYANENNVTGIVFAGDAFHRRNPSDTERLEFFRLFAQFLQDRDDRWVIIMPGTPSHDGQDMILPTQTSLTIYKELARFGGFQKRFSVVSKPAVIEREGVEYYIAVGLGEKTVDVEAMAALWERSKARKDTRRVLVVHGAVSGAKVGPGDFELPNPYLSTDDLHPARFDLIVSGHLHKHQTIQEKIVIPGSIDRVDFGERNEDKGFLSWDPGTNVWEFVQVKSAKRFVMLDIDLDQEGFSGLPDLGGDKGAIVKLRFKGSRAAFRKIDLVKVAAEIEGGFAPMNVSIECNRVDEERKPTEIKELNYDEMLRAWLKSRDDLPKDVKKEAFQRGVQILTEAR